MYFANHTQQHGVGGRALRLNNIGLGERALILNNMGLGGGPLHSTT